MEPSGIRNRAGHDEEMANVVTLDLAGLIVAPLDPLEAAVPIQGDDLGVSTEDDRGILVDTANQVSGHRVGQAGSPHQHVDPTRRRCQKHGCLPGRVATTTITTSSPTHSWASMGVAP
jgi:hypothetical protein